MIADQANRNRIENELDTTFVVEAAAGTGKTTALVSRMMAVLKAGATLDRLVAVTFTEAAAGELKLRLRSAIEQARQNPAQPPEIRERLTRTLPHLEQARIGTIHSFCADLLRERPVEAGVDPQFQVAAEDISQMLFGQAFDRWFERALNQPGEAVRRILRRHKGDGPRQTLREAAWNLQERRDFSTPWQAAPFDRVSGVDEIVEALRPLAAVVGEWDVDDWFTKSLQQIANFVSELERREKLSGGRDYDGLENELRLFSTQKHWAWKGYTPRGRDQQEARQRKLQLAEARAAVHARIQEFVRRAGADLAPRLQSELREVVEEYQLLKQRAGYLDFLDLLLRARDLVRSNQTVRAELQQRFTHLFVDEFQDTDPVQAEILLLLGADEAAQADWKQVRPKPGKLFLVGDPKQSIYRFRRADTSLYLDVQRRLLDKGAALLHLSTSFRAVAAIQQAVNGAFPARMDGTSRSQARYVPLEAFREPLPAQPAVVVVPVPAPYGWRNQIDKASVKASLPEAVAAFLEWLVGQSGWKVTERDGAPVAIQPRHICLLFKRFKSFREDVTGAYVRALEARHLPHVLVGGGSLHSREEVEVVRNALAAIERPHDELALFATLRGPLFALGDGQLLAYRARFHSLHPWRQMPDDLPPALREVADALAVLRDLHVRRNRRPLSGTIADLLAATRAHAAFAIWPNGEQALANVHRVMDVARRAERTGIISFRSFVQRLENEAEAGEAGEAPIVEEGTEGIRIMTVHKAKGLEFPVVVLVDPGANETPQQASRWVDAERELCAQRLADCSPQELVDHEAEELEREREEATRLLYVAATRTRDLLVLTAVGEKPLEGWLSALHPAIYPAAEDSRHPMRRDPAGCPLLAGDTVRVLPPEVERPLEAVAPGEHRAQVGDHTVVWWDAHQLQPVPRPSLGQRQQKLLEADAGEMRSEQGIRDQQAWQERRAQIIERGSLPSVVVSTATEMSKDGPPPATPITVVEVGKRWNRPHGMRFGTLVHAVMATVNLDADEEAVGAAAQLQGRLLGAEADEVVTASRVVLEALQHPLMQEAARATTCRRECPVSMRMADGTLMEGIVDAAFLHDGAWTVIDFKTDVDARNRLHEYRTQIGLYAQAIEQSSHSPVKSAVLLHI